MDIHILGDLQLLSHTLRKGDTARKLIYVGRISAASRDTFITVTARPTEEIKKLGFFKVDLIGQDIIEAFLGYICSRSSRPVLCWWIESMAFKLTPYYTHALQK